MELAVYAHVRRQVGTVVLPVREESFGAVEVALNLEPCREPFTSIVRDWHDGVYPLTREIPEMNVRVGHRNVPAPALPKRRTSIHEAIIAAGGGASEAARACSTH